MNIKYLLIGETCIDKYIYTQFTKPSPEDLSVPVLKIVKETQSFGMAAITREEMNKLDLNTKFITNEAPITLVKTRLYRDGSQICRLDEDILFADMQFTYLKTKKYLEEVDVVVVSDYGKGFLDPTMIKLISESGKRVYLDPHPDNDLKQYRKVYCLKMNEKELVFFTNTTELEKGVEKLRELIQFEHLFITRGKDGISYFDVSNNRIDSPSRISAPKNVAGAGDAVMASIARDMELGVSIPFILENAMEIVAVFLSENSNDQ